jgi:hypothetical protein
LIKGGEEVNRFVGGKSKADIEAWLVKNGVEKDN